MQTIAGQDVGQSRFNWTKTHADAARLIALLTYIVIAYAFVLPDVGRNWDENEGQRFAQRAVEHARRFVGGKAALEPAAGDEHGTGLEVFLYSVDKVEERYFRADDRTRAFTRHALILTVFFAGALFLYGSMIALFGLGPSADFGIMCYLLHPRIFAHAFHNSYDTGFAAACCAAFFFLLRYQQSPSQKRALALGLAVGFSASIRNVGVLWIALTLLAMTSRLWKARHTQRLQILGSLALFIFSALATTLLLWPFLWANPVRRAVWALKQMSAIPWEEKVLYLGKLIPAAHLPWHYNFVWIGLTTPLIVLITFVVGTAILLKKKAGGISHLPENFSGRGIALLWFGVPLALPILFHSVLFDGWRHHYFVYPATVILSASGFEEIRRTLFHRVAARSVVQLICFGAIGLQVVHLIKSHPYQDIYFNSLARVIVGRQPDTNHAFDMDYWGLSYRKGLEEIASRTHGDVNIFYPEEPISLNMSWLSKQDRERIHLVNEKTLADFFMSTYRWHPSEFTAEDGTEIYARYVGPTKILTVRKLR